MLPFFADFLDRLEAMHEAIEQAVAGLPPEALDWRPGPEMNSIAVLVAHTAGAERYWIGDVAGQEPSGRVRAAEFETAGVETAVLLAKLQAALDHSRGVLESLTLANLELERVSPRDGRVYTVGWALSHALEHTALHAGHIQLTRQLWENKQA
ncbi:MAG: DUF664 domain-containing protein [Chloroflexi bacterium]|nr:DUF664 domain-containing protein [Chloroflexota bacterium]